MDVHSYCHIFKLSDVDGKKFLECKAHPIQKEKVNFEIDPEKGVRFFDPFNFFTRGIYKDMDGLTVWTTDNLKEPWKYDASDGVAEFTLHACKRWCS